MNLVFECLYCFESVAGEHDPNDEGRYVCTPCSEEIEYLRAAGMEIDDDADARTEARELMAGFRPDPSNANAVHHFDPYTNTVRCRHPFPIL